MYCEKNFDIYFRVGQINYKSRYFSITYLAFFKNGLQKTHAINALYCQMCRGKFSRFLFLNPPIGNGLFAMISQNAINVT